MSNIVACGCVRFSDILLMTHSQSIAWCVCCCCCSLLFRVDAISTQQQIATTVQLTACILIIYGHSVLYFVVVQKYIDQCGSYGRIPTYGQIKCLCAILQRRNEQKMRINFKSTLTKESWSYCCCMPSVQCTQYAQYVWKAKSEKEKLSLEKTKENYEECNK